MISSWIVTEVNLANPFEPLYENYIKRIKGLELYQSYIMLNLPVYTKVPQYRSLNESEQRWVRDILLRVTTPDPS